MRPRQNNFFLHLHTPWHPDVELSKFYRRSFSRSRCKPRPLPLLGLFNTFLRTKLIFPDVYARRIVPDFPVDSHNYC